MHAKGIERTYAKKVSEICDVAYAFGDCKGDHFIRSMRELGDNFTDEQKTMIDALYTEVSAKYNKVYEEGQAKLARYAQDGKIWHLPGCYIEHSPICTCGLLYDLHSMILSNKHYPNGSAEHSAHVAAVTAHRQPSFLPQSSLNARTLCGNPLTDFPDFVHSHHKAACPCYRCRNPQAVH